LFWLRGVMMYPRFITGDNVSQKLVALLLAFSQETLTHQTEQWQVEAVLEDEVSECTMSQDFLWLWRGDSSGTQRKGNVRHWKPVPDDWWWDSRPRRLSATYSYLQTAWNSDSVTDCKC
jgi:hypothetical protein